MLTSISHISSHLTSDKQRLDAIFEDVNVIKTRWEWIFMGRSGLQDTDLMVNLPGDPLERRVARTRLRLRLGSRRRTTRKRRWRRSSRRSKNIPRRRTVSSCQQGPSRSTS